MGTHGDQAVNSSHTLRPLPFSLLNPLPGLGAGTGERSILEGQDWGGKAGELQSSWKGLISPHPHWVPYFSLVPDHRVQTGGLGGFRGRGALGVTGLPCLSWREGTWRNLERERTQSSAFSSFCFSS